MLKKLSYIIVVLSACVFMSCDSIIDEGSCSTGGDRVRRVSFTLTIDDARPETRAAWNESYVTDIGASYDSRIALEGLQVLFFTTNNSYVGRVGSLMHWPTSASEYRFAGDATDLNLSAGEAYKVVVLANCPDAVANLGSLYFSLEDIVYPNGYVPMWGVKQMTMTGEELQDLGDIMLLRSVAKIEVVLSDAMVAKGYSLDGVSIDHYNDHGYCLPKGWDVVANTVDLDQESCLNAYHSHKADMMDFTEVEKGKSHWLYIPEFNVLHTASNRPKLSVTLGDGSSTPLVFDDAIMFGLYDSDGYPVEGSEANIVRNHIYRFNIVGVGSAIEFDYEVLDWEDGGAWDRGVFEYPTYHNPVVPNYLDPMALITEKPVMTYDNVDPLAGAFSVWFRMSEPLGQVWTPVVDKADTDYSIKVFNTAGVEITDPAQWVAADAWYNIKVIPLDPGNAGDVVRFGITYRQNWMPSGMSMYLFINGKVDEIAWPNSGSDPKIIEIKQN